MGSPVVLSNAASSCWCRLGGPLSVGQDEGAAYADGKTGKSTGFPRENQEENIGKLTFQRPWKNMFKYSNSVDFPGNPSILNDSFSNYCSRKLVVFHLYKPILIQAAMSYPQISGPKKDHVSLLVADPLLLTRAHTWSCITLMVYDTVDRRNHAPVDRWCIPVFIGLQPSVWWCRISQPSTVGFWSKWSSKVPRRTEYVHHWRRYWCKLGEINRTCLEGFGNIWKPLLH